MSVRPSLSRASAATLCADAIGAAISTASAVSAARAKGEAGTSLTAVSGCEKAVAPAYCLAATAGKRLHA